MNELANAMSRLSVESTDLKHPNLMSQANLLLTPLDGDIFTETGSLDDPYIIQCPPNTAIGSSSPEMSSTDDELPPGIVLCSSIPKVQPTPPQPRNGNGIEKESTFANAQKVPAPRKKSRGLHDIYDNHIIDEELPLEKSSRKKDSGLSLNRSRFYEIHVGSPRCLLTLPGGFGELCVFVTLASSFRGYSHFLRLIKRPFELGERATSTLGVYRPRKTSLYAPK